MEFKEEVKQMKRSEKNVDKVLKAARLERHEKAPMDMERLKFLVESGLLALGMILVFAFFFMMFYMIGR